MFINFRRSSILLNYNQEVLRKVKSISPRVQKYSTLSKLSKLDAYQGGAFQMRRTTSAHLYELFCWLVG